MALSRSAREFAAEIKNHDWQDSPYRADRAGHNRARDPKAPEQTLQPEQEAAVRTNVMWVVAQVLAYRDPNFDVYEFAEACGVNVLKLDGSEDRSIEQGLRRGTGGRYATPGTWDHMGA